MSFTSLPFFGCLLVAVALFYLLPSRWRHGYLLALSYLFYAVNSRFYLALLVAATAITYYAAILIAKAQSDARKLVPMWAVIVALVALLVGLKLRGSLNGILLPLGISYFSFKLIAYLVDVYWDERELVTDPIQFFLYIAFFPQIVSGPIQRPNDFFEQLGHLRSQSEIRDDLEDGFRLLLGGLLMKLLVGDRLGQFIEIVDSDPASYQWPVTLTLVACYTLQLYADFSGYTNIALGIGKLFGISGPLNFKAPFAAPNIQVMWQRWHMSLTSWVTDYLFTPLNMTLRRLGQAGLMLCITINMVVIGLWHGITANFLAFGLCHALFVMGTVVTAKWRNRLFGKSARARAIRNTVGIVLTFVFMSFSMIFWHNPSWHAVRVHLSLALHPARQGALGFDAIRTDAVEPLLVCMVLAFYIGLGAPGARALGDRITRIVPNWMQYGFYLLLLSALTIESGSAFIYGQF